MAFPLSALSVRVFAHFGLILACPLHFWHLPGPPPWCTDLLTQSSFALAKLNLYKSDFPFQLSKWENSHLMLGGRKDSESYEAWKRIKWKDSRCTNSDVPLERGRRAFSPCFCQVWIFPGPDLLMLTLISHPTQNPVQGGHELFGKNTCKQRSAGAQRGRIGVISLKPDFHL